MARRTLLLLLVATAAMALASTADARCVPIKRHSVQIAKGTSPSGLLWSVEGTIGENGRGCHEWLLGVNFNMQGAVDWGSSSGIPAGGHRGRREEVSANDYLLSDGSDRVFSGTVGGEVAKVVVTLSDNKQVVIHPKLPPSQLRRKVVWLRNLKYFVAYYKPLGFATQVRTFSRSGQLLSRDRHFESF